MTLIRRVLALDPCGDLHKELRRARDGWGVIRARPNNRASQVLYADLLEAIGKTTMSSYRGRAANHTAALAYAWLAAGTIEHFAVRGAQQLDPKRLRDLCTLTAACGITTWLIDETHPNETRATTRDRLAIDDATISDLIAARARAAEPAKPMRRRRETRLPDVHFLAFLPTAQEQLPYDEFDALLPDYRHALAATRDWLDAEPEPTEPAFAHHLYELTKHTTHLDSTLVLARGAQAGAFLAGWYALVDVNRFVHRGAGQVIPVRLASDDWSALATLLRPADAAVCALAVTGLTVSEIAALPADCVADDGSVVTFDGTARCLPEQGRVAVVAQHIYRNLVQPTSDQYLATGAKDSVVTSKRVGALLHAITRNTGVVLRARQRARDIPTHPMDTSDGRVHHEARHMRIDAELLRSRRLELGLSQRALARIARVSHPLVTRLEETGNVDHLECRTLERILESLSLEVASALATPGGNGPQMSRRSAAPDGRGLRARRRQPIFDSCILALRGQLTTRRAALSRNGNVSLQRLRNAHLVDILHNGRVVESDVAALIFQAGSPLRSHP